MTLGESLGRAQRLIARTRTGTRLAMKLRNQCDAIIGARLGEPSDVATNGEAWLVDLVRHEVKQFVDVGANVGSWSLRLLESGGAEPNGILYEPSPETASCLRDALSARGWNQLTVVQAAVGAAAGHAAFYVEPGHGETASLHAAHSRTGATQINVPVITLDEDLTARGIDGVDLLKIDAEGNDFEVLRGCSTLLRQHKIALVQFEYNAPWRYSGATIWRACQMLRDFGYEIRILKARGLAPFNEKAVGEYYRYTNFVSYCPGTMADLLEGKTCRALI